MRGNPGHNTRPHARLPPSFLGMDDLTTDCSFDSQAKCVIGVLGLLFDLLSMGVCTTRYWQQSDRLVQKLNVFTVDFQKNWRTISMCTTNLNQSWKGQ